MDECAPSTSSSEFQELLAVSFCTTGKLSTPALSASKFSGRMTCGNAAGAACKLETFNPDACGLIGKETGRSSFNTDSLNCPNCDRNSSKECISELRVSSTFCKKCRNKNQITKVIRREGVTSTYEDFDQYENQKLGKTGDNVNGKVTCTASAPAMRDRFLSSETSLTA
jgi:hypothetical protein